MRVAFFIVLLATMGCLAKDEADGITFRITGAYSLNLPIDSLRGATVANSDDILIRFADGTSLGAKVVMPEMDDLPAPFDMRSYPEYYLGLREPDDVSPEISQSFLASHRELMARHPQSTRFEQRADERRFLGLISDDHATIFMTVDSNPRHVLFLDFGQMDLGRINSILERIR